MKLNEHLVVITRDLTQNISKREWEHEIPILTVIHGSGNIQTQGVEEIDFPTFNVVEEYERMKRLYNRKPNHEDVVNRVYGEDASRLAERLGIDTKQAKVVRGPIQTIQIDNRKRGVRGAVPVEPEKPQGRGTLRLSQPSPA
jgi:hypothetical protein